MTREPPASLWDYEFWLDRARSMLPKKEISPEEMRRWKVPKPVCIVQRGQIIVRNFREIAEALRRDVKHLLRFFSKELATAGSVQGELAIFQGRFSERDIERLLDRYVKEFVVCPVCKSPDTVLEKRGKRMYFLICEACGAISSVRAL